MDTIDTVLNLSTESVFLFIALGMLRPLGMLFGFSAFAWGLAMSVTTRAAAAIAISLPIMLVSADQLAELAKGTRGIALAVLTPKEFAIGYSFGLVASLPLLALQYAGAITDAYRGESSSGIHDPSGGAMQTFGLLYLMIGLFAFFAVGGLWHLVATLYASYEIWPIDVLVPGFRADAWASAGTMVNALLQDALLIAAPLLILLVAVDFILAVAARTAQRFRIYENAFAGKQLTAILTLPVLTFYILRVADGKIDDALSALPRLQAFFP